MEDDRHCPSSGVCPPSSGGAIAQLGERVLCKHEVVGSIPSGSTIREGTDGGLGGLKEDGTPPSTASILSMRFISFARALKRALWRGRPEGRRRTQTVLRRSFSGLSISDIVKRKRIRSRAGWARRCRRAVRFGLREAPCLFIRPFEQPVVGLEPDRSDPRMRLKQNWSFQRQGRSEMDNRTTDVKVCGPFSVLSGTRFGDESNQVS